MIKVEFRSLETVGGVPTEVYGGSITLTDDKRVVVEPVKQKAFFRELLNKPVNVIDEETGKRTQYVFKKDPEGWLRNACQMYRAYTFWASLPIELN